MKDRHVNKQIEPSGRRRLSLVALLVIFLSCASLFPTPVFSQTLDEAVAEQLGTSCTILLAGGFLSNLNEPLRSICLGGGSGGTNFPPSSTGGGAGTPTTLPGIVKERMEREKKADEGSTVIELSRSLNFFFSAEHEELDRKVTTFEDGYDSYILRFTAGVDLQITESLVTGLALDTSRHKGDYLSDGSFENDSYGIIAFGMLFPTDRTFLQVYGGYASMSNKRERLATFTDFDSVGAITISVTGTPDVGYNSYKYSAGLMAGYDLPLGALTIGPRAGIDWSRTKYDTYSETDVEGLSGLELTFYDDKEKSLFTTLGLTTSVAGSTDFGVVVAEQGIYWKHEYEMDQREVEVSFVGDTRAKRFTYKTEMPDRDSFEFNAGLLFALPKGIQAFVNFRTLLGHNFLDNHAETIGMRYEM